MKKTVISLLALVAAVAAPVLDSIDMNAQNSGRGGRVLTSSWEKYEKAEKADLPQEAASILEAIKKDAAVKRLPVDFYDAGKALIDVRARRDWKQREGARAEFARDVEDFGMAIVTFRWMEEGGNTASQWNFVKDNATELKQYRTSGLYSNLGMMSGVLRDFVKDDYEYTLWTLLQRRNVPAANPSSDEIWSALNGYLDGRYPLAAYLEYYTASSDYSDEGRARMKALSEKYNGTAVGLFPAETVLRNRFSDLERSRESSEQDYMNLLSDCRAHEKIRSSFKGDEKKIASVCTSAESLIRTLNSSAKDIIVRGDSVGVVFRNAKNAKVILHSAGDKKTTVWSSEVINTARRFYLQDTSWVSLPDIDDGDYTLYLDKVAGDDRISRDYVKKRISLAVKNGPDGYSLFAADYKTGRPVEEGKVSIARNGKVIASGNMKFGSGFTFLPSALKKAVSSSGKKNPLVFRCEYKGKDGKMRRSKDVSVWTGSGYDAGSSESFTSATIMKDRGAYNPGDTVKFKVVCFTTLNAESRGRTDRADFFQEARRSFHSPMYSVLEAGTELIATLYDSEGNKLKEKGLTTNDFGSVAGEFALPSGLRNGLFSITVRLRKGPNGDLASDWFRVDEFVLPTFDVAFDKSEELFLTGEQVKVTGKVTSYSGHSLTAARMEASITNYSSPFLESIDVPIAPDGSFEVAFVPEKTGRYTIIIKVIDKTGETLDFSRTVAVFDSFYLTADLKGCSKGSVILPCGKETLNGSILPSGIMVAQLYLRNYEGVNVEGKEIRYVLSTMDGREIKKGSVLSGNVISIELPSSGAYKLEYNASVSHKDKEDIKQKGSICFVSLGAQDKFLDYPVDQLYQVYGSEVGTGGKFGIRFGTTVSPVWIITMITGFSEETLASRIWYLDGKAGASGSLKNLEFEYLKSWPEAVRISTFFFRDGKVHRYSEEISHKPDKDPVPLSFSSFTDKCFPRTEITVGLETRPGMEILAGVWDKSIDSISQNYWAVITAPETTAPYISLNSACGFVGDERPFRPFYKAMATRSTALGAVNTQSLVLYDEVAEEEGAVSAFRMDSQEDTKIRGTDKVTVREKFESSLCFQPFIRSDAHGKAEFSFTTSDKLSTYYVSCYAHDKQMNNAIVRREMVVSLPVKTALNAPRYLYEGDMYDAEIAVSSNSDKDIRGTLALEVYDTKDHKAARPVSVHRREITVPAGSSASGRFALRASGTVAGLKAVFISDGFSDAVFEAISVEKPVQKLRESHSAVVLAGSDEAAILDRLRREFVNVPGEKAELKRITVLDMVRDAVPAHVDPDGDDVLSLSEAYYTRLLAGKTGIVVPEDGGALLKRILRCRNADGGFGWFEGMNSNQAVTATLLNRFAKLRDLGFGIPDMTATVKWLDRNYFESGRLWWCGGISEALYMSVRSRYSSVPFVLSDAASAKDRFKEFKKSAASYLTPSSSSGRGLKGQILAKAMRIQTLECLMKGEGGIALAKAWGVNFNVSARLLKSIKADMASLIEYAVSHRDGGWYYPNAVMPWRGLLESEAYAHSLLCGILSDPTLIEEKKVSKASEIADGIRLWLMLQKETQKWDAGPEFIDAISAILEGSERVLETQVISLSAEYQKPFKDIKSAGNGFTVSRRFFRDGVEILPGTPVKVGDRIEARYEIWNAENRSFVRLTAPREASLQCVKQLSGHYSWGFRAIGYRGWSLVPQGYRNVKADRTEYFFDSYPEESTAITEEFFVTRAGTFTAPVVTIESLYADHYRANAPFPGMLTSE